MLFVIPNKKNLKKKRAVYKDLLKPEEFLEKDRIGFYELDENYNKVYVEESYNLIEDKIFEYYNRAIELTNRLKTSEGVLAIELIFKLMKVEAILSTLIMYHQNPPFNHHYCITKIELEQIIHDVNLNDYIDELEISKSSPLKLGDMLRRTFYSHDDVTDNILFELNLFN